MHGATTKVAANLFQSGTLSLGINFSKSFHSFWVPCQLVCTRCIKKAIWTPYHRVAEQQNALNCIPSPIHMLKFWSPGPQNVTVFENRVFKEAFKVKSTLNVHWKDWCWSWSSSILATWCKELTHWKRPWCWERLKAGGKGTTEDEMVR